MHILNLYQHVHFPRCKIDIYLENTCFKDSKKETANEELGIGSHKPWHIVMIPQKNIKPLNHTLGATFFSTMLLGTSRRM
jgi:hypothetical protein